MPDANVPGSKIGKSETSQRDIVIHKALAAAVISMGITLAFSCPYGVSGNFSAESNFAAFRYSSFDEKFGGKIYSIRGAI